MPHTQIKSQSRRKLVSQARPHAIIVTTDALQSAGKPIISDKASALLCRLVCMLPQMTNDNSSSGPCQQRSPAQRSILLERCHAASVQCCLKQLMIDCKTKRVNNFASAPTCTVLVLIAASIVPDSCRVSVDFSSVEITCVAPRSFREHCCRVVGIRHEEGSMS